MEIKSQYEIKGRQFISTYQDWTPGTVTDPSKLDGVHSFCFYKDKLVIVSSAPNHWTPPGGGIEKGETFEEASIREVKEESNMRVIYQECIGYQDVEIIDQNRIVRQFRMFCIVEPYGEFESDPDGDILEVKLINPKDYKEYIKWGEIGDHLIKRSLEMFNNYNDGFSK